MNRWIVLRHEQQMLPYPICEVVWVWVMKGEPVETQVDAMDLAKQHISSETYIAEIKLKAVSAFDEVSS